MSESDFLCAAGGCRNGKLCGWMRPAVGCLLVDVEERYFLSTVTKKVCYVYVYIGIYVYKHVYGIYVNLEKIYSPDR